MISTPQKLGYSSYEFLLLGTRIVLRKSWQLTQNNALCICFVPHVGDAYISIICLLKRLSQIASKGWLNTVSQRAVLLK